MNKFTMSEYIVLNKLNVSPHDPRATKRIARHLREKGFRPQRVKKEGRWKQIWTNEPVADMTELELRLKEL